MYKLEVGANRHDLLCVEGIAAAIKSYLGTAKIPKLTIKNESPELLKIYAKSDTRKVR